MSTTPRGSIEPEMTVEKVQVAVSTSVLVDDFGVMSYEVRNEGVSFFFGMGNDDRMHVGFTDRSLLNLARLVNQAVCATLRVRGIPVPEYVGQENPPPSSLGSCSGRVAPS